MTDHIGRGISFPFRQRLSNAILVGDVASGRTAMSDGDARIREIVSQVFGTERGSRVMNRGIGFIGSRVVFWPITESMGEQIVYWGNDALDSFGEDRIRFIKAGTDLSAMNDGYILIDITVFIVQSRRITSYVHRQYLPGLA